MIIKPVKGIFLDIGWTINYPATGDWMITKKIIEYANKNTFSLITKERQESIYKKCMAFLDSNHLVLSEIEELEQFKKFYTMMFDLLPEFQFSSEQIEQIALDRVYNNENYIFYDDVKDTLKQLREKYKLGIISDTWPSTKRILEDTGIYNYFSSITFSCNLGIFKPNQKMYAHAIETMGIEANQTIFVDDSIKNLEGAKKIGIQPVLINRKEKGYKHEDYICIEKISDLLNIL